VGIAFTHPWYLALLPPLAAVCWWAARGSLAGLSRGRRRVALGLRLVALGLLVAALAGLQAVYHTRAMGVVFALDVSRSVDAQAQARALDYIARAVREMRSEDRAALVVFGGEPSLEVSAAARPRVTTIHSRPPADETDIAAALRLAFAVLPPRCGKRVVLLSDGIETRGDALDQALSAQAMGIEVSCVSLSSRPQRELLVEEMTAPPQVRVGEPFDLRVVVSATSETEVTLRAYRDGAPVEARAVRLAPGRNVLALTQSIDRPGFHRFQVLLDSDHDAYPENNRGLAFTTVRGKPRVLYVEGEAQMAAPLRQALAEHDIAVDVVGLAGIPKTAAELAAYDAVLFSEVPAMALHPEQMKLIQRAVSDLGIGFGMLGGEYGFGAGGYFKTPIEDVLPVNMSIRKYRVFPAAAVVLVMDTSGSTGMMEGGQPKIRLEAEAAIAAVESLQDSDQVAVVVSGQGSTVLAPLRRARQRADIISDIARMQSGGGGIYCRPSLEQAYSILRSAEARTKHVVMLADGDDCDEQEGCIAMAAAMNREKITTTAIAFGQGKDVGFLQGLAAAGGGSFYLATAGHQLPRIFTRDILLSSRSLIVEEPFVPEVRRHETVAGINWGQAPPLLGYVATAPKPLASVPLSTPQGDPLFAAWRYGLGRSIAFTSDARARWGAHWLGWDGYGKFWPQAVRWMMRLSRDSGLRPTVKIDRGEGTVAVDALTSTGEFRDFLQLQAKVVAPDPDSSGQTLDLKQTAPGRYEAKFTAGAVGQYVVSVTEAGAAVATAGAAVPFPAEYRRLEPDRHLLSELARRTGGKVDLKPKRVFEPAAAARYPQDLWHWLLAAALVLWPLDIAVRRLVISWAQLAQGVAGLRARLRREPHVAPAPTSALLDRTRRVRVGHARAQGAVPPVATGVPRPPPAVAERPSAPPPGKPVVAEAQAEETAAAPAAAQGLDTTGRLVSSKRRRHSERDGEETS